MVVPTFSVTCTENIQLTHDVFQLTFTKPDGFVFQAGQFILFDVPHPDNKDDIQARAYSIASTPDEKDLLFVIRLLPNGRMSRWIVEKLRPGTSTLSLKGPFGNFLLTPDTDTRLLFLCTSTGNAPFRSQILHALATGDRRRMDLIYGVRSEEDLFWRAEFERLQAEHDNFSLHLALTRPSDAWAGHRGRVQTIAPQVVTDFSRTHVYLCGSPAMTKEVKDLCLNAWGMEKKHVHAEGYM